MTLQLLVLALVLSLMYMSVWLVVARHRKRLDTVDWAWGGGFIVVALAVALAAPSTRTILVAVLVSIWGGRLMWHIIRRSLRKTEDDPRYTALAEKWQSKTSARYWLRAYVSIFLTQAVLVCLVALPVVFAAGEVMPAWRWLFTVGYLLWVVGFIIEYYADKQLADFLAGHKQSGKQRGLLDSGLWRYSRHPNYFGEAVQWWGIGLIALQTRYGWIGLLGPLAITILIRFVSGVPPIEKRRADDAAYQRYKRRTNAFVPWFSR